VKARFVVLGAGFGGLELATLLSEALGSDAGIALIDENDAFVFGYSKLDVMFGRKAPREVRLPYADFAKPGVRFLRETITAIDPEARRVTTNRAVHEADVLVVALGADYDFDATPGLAEGGSEFYSVRGAERLHVPAGAKRGGVASRRLPVAARSPRRLRDLARDAVRDPGPSVAGHLGRASDSVRRARHRVRPRPPGELARPGTQRRRARRRR